MMYSQRVNVRSMEDTGQEEEFREDRGEEKGFKEDTGEEDESMEDLGSSEEHTGSEGEDYVDPPPSLQQTDSVGCSSSLAPQTDEAPVPRETQSPCVVRLTDKDTEQDNDKMHQLTLQLAKNRPHRQTARKRFSITIKSESDGHEADDGDYDPNEDVSASSDDAGGDEHEDKNVNGEATAPRGRHSCAICGRSFCAASKLKRHSRTHTGEKPFSCADCAKNFSQTYHLRRHRRRAHSQDNLYPCQGGGEVERDDAPIPSETQSPCVRLTDKETEQDNDETQQQLTVQLAKTRPHRHTARKRTSIKSEPDGHEDDEDYDPNDDGGDSNDDADGGNDADKNADGAGIASMGRHYCAICDRSFSSAYKLKRHNLTHTGEKPFHCADCVKTYRHTHSLLKHRRRAHGQDNLYPCPDCVECFLTNAELRTHRVLHSQEKEAERQKKKESNMGRVRMRFFSYKQKEGQTVSSFIAELRALAAGCGFGDEQETRIRDRILCGVIDKSLLQNTLRDERQLTLQLVEEKALVTEKAKTDPHLHKARKKISIQSEPDHHNEEGGGSSDDAGTNTNGKATSSRRLHSCAICNWTFRRAYELERHSRTHTGEKPYKCADCGKTFSQTYHLRHHRRNIHHQDNLYPCPGGAEVETGEAPNPSEMQNPCIRLTDKDTEQNDDETQQLTLQLVEEKAMPSEKTKTNPQHHTARKSISIQSEPDGHENDYDHNDDSGDSSDDAGGGNDVDKNADGELTASRGRHYCAICDRSFSSAYKLKRHNLTHTGEKPFCCVDCGKTYRHTHSLLKHRRRAHGLDDLYPCPEGAEGKETTSRRRYYCVICKRNFHTTYRLKLHSRTHTGERPFCCTHCNKTYSQTSHLRRHMKMHREKPYRCPDCNLSFRDEAAFIKHRQEKERLKERVEKKPYPCSRCDEGFSSLAELTSHMPVHQGEEPQICPDCGRSFHIRRKFQRHRELHLVVTKHLCNECGKHMPSAASLKQHLLVHSGAKPHPCTLCGQSYSKPYYLKCHMRVHSGITQKRHACLDCGRTFSRISDVRRHQMTHTGEKPFRCLHCGKSFLSQEKVKVHMRTHTGEKPYACLACGKRFTQSGDRNRHMSRCHHRVTIKNK